MQKHLLAIAVILTVASGCDNVAWGGVDMELRPPPEPEPGEVVEVGSPESESGPVNLDGPLLLAGIREEGSATFVVVGEILPDGLTGFPDTRFPEDTLRLADMASADARWILFSEGVRVGRLLVEDTTPASGYCGSRTAVTGVVELVPEAAGAQRFLALPESAVDDVDHAPYVSIDHVYDQRVASLSIANDAIAEYGAQWPAPGVLDARDHIQAFQLGGVRGQSIAASFLFEDELRIGAPGEAGYALFVIGQDIGGEYRDAYTWYRPAQAEGKGAPRYFDHLDWDLDGSDEILLDVFGTDRRWFAALDRTGEGWTRTFQDGCGISTGG